MTTEDRNDAILVKIIRRNYDNEEKFVAAWYTTAIDQTLRAFQTCKDYNIKCSFNQFTEEIDLQELKNEEHYIVDVWFSFGSATDIPVIDVIIV